MLPWATEVKTFGNGFFRKYFFQSFSTIDCPYHGNRIGFFMNSLAILSISYAHRVLFQLTRLIKFQFLMTCGQLKLKPHLFDLLLICCGLLWIDCCGFCTASILLCICRGRAHLLWICCTTNPQQIQQVEYELKLAVRVNTCTFSAHVKYSRIVSYINSE